MRDRKFFSISLNSTMHNGHKFIFPFLLCMCIRIHQEYVNSKKTHKNTTYFVFPLRFPFFFRMNLFSMSEWKRGQKTIIKVIMTEIQDWPRCLLAVSTHTHTKHNVS